MTMENIYLIASLCAVMIKIIKPVKKYYLQVVDSYINYIKKNKENRERKFYSIKEKLYTNLRILKVFNYLKNDEILKNLKLIEKSRNIIKERMYSKNKEENTNTNNFIDIMLSLISTDIENTIKNVCFKILNDFGVCKKIRERRATNLLYVGSIFYKEDYDKNRSKEFII